MQKNHYMEIKKEQVFEIEYPSSPYNKLMVVSQAE